MKKVFNEAGLTGLESEAVKKTIAGMRAADEHGAMFVPPLAIDNSLEVSISTPHKPRGNQTEQQKL